MDLAKFISLLSKKSLYFSCLCNFNDPYEGYFPKPFVQDLARSQLEQISAINAQKKTVEEELAKRTLLSNNPKAKQFFDNGMKYIDICNNETNKTISEVIEEEKSKTGAICWHVSEHESEAMWKLYSAAGQGIAIESTIGQLKDSLTNEESLKIKEVEYLDFENYYNEDIRNSDVAFLKRKSFEHEKELRATILLKEQGKGAFVECNLDILITQIHISPLTETYFKEIVEDICKGKVSGIDKKVIRSPLFDKPNYEALALLGL